MVNALNPDRKLVSNFDTGVHRAASSLADDREGGKR